MMKLEDLQLKLGSSGLVNITFIVVNHQGHHSQLKYHLLREKVSEDIPVYQQNATQPDVWASLRGKKDDFLIYDRCGRLVFHLGLPYTFLSFPYVEKAIQVAYCENTCGNCSYTTPEIEELCKRISENSEEKQIEAASASQLSPTEHPHHHHHHHPHHHHRHHHHHAHHPKGDQTEVNNQHNSSVLGLDPAEAALLSAAMALQGDRL
ncbi:hypothetical protein E2320_017701 [Naja naja]|nr:hypothetical protein E2320_017701 [Naja naja]